MNQDHLSSILPLPEAGPWHSITPTLEPEILETLASFQFTSMTPVQSQTIPILLKKRDVIVEAVTGSGKTLAYLIPILHFLLKKNRSKEPLKKHQIGVIIISPTRELAFQIYRILQRFFPHSHSNYPLPTTHEPTLTSSSTSSLTSITEASFVTHALFVGGAQAPEDDLAHFRLYGAHLIVATPGRLDSFLHPTTGRCLACLKECDWLILDEADKLLDSGLGSTLQSIVSTLPKQRHTGLFSATLTDHLSTMLTLLGGLRSPIKIMVQVTTLHPQHGTMEQWRTPSSLHIHYLVVPTSLKTDVLMQCLKENAIGKKTMVFFATCYQVAYWYQMLQPYFFSSFSSSTSSSFSSSSSFLPNLFCLHGHLTPKQRQKVYQRFIHSDCHEAVLFCTDVAARGLDIPCLDYVIQFDAPTDPSMFAHRCGRTGRQSQFGTALLFLTEPELMFIEFLHVRNILITPFTPMSSTLASLLDSTSSSSSSSSLSSSPSTTSSTPISLVTRTWPEKLTQDRALFDLSVRAFVSYIRAYSLHQLMYIFRLDRLDWQGLIDLFGLIQIPSMPELKKYKPNCVVPYPDLDLNSITYKDPQREAARLNKLKLKESKLKSTNTTSPSSSSSLSLLKQHQQLRRPGRPTSTVPWSGKKLRLLKKQLRKAKRQGKRRPEFPILLKKIQLQKQLKDALVHSTKKTTNYELNKKVPSSSSSSSKTNSSELKEEDEIDLSKTSDQFQKFHTWLNEDIESETSGYSHHSSSSPFTNQCPLQHSTTKKSKVRSLKIRASDYDRDIGYQVTENKN